jgi:hypothetical protein
MPEFESAKTDPTRSNARVSPSATATPVNYKLPRQIMHAHPMDTIYEFFRVLPWNGIFLIPVSWHNVALVGILLYPAGGWIALFD